MQISVESMHVFIGLMLQKSLGPSASYIETEVVAR